LDGTEEIAVGDDVVPNEDVDAATMELRQVIEAQQAAGKELSEKLLNTIIAQRAAILEEQDTVNSQKTRITALESQVERLTAQVDQLNKSVLLNQNRKLNIDGRTYDKFPAGNLNAGLFVTKQPHVVTIDDVDYSETTVLSQFKGLELGGTLTEVVTLNRIPFRRISGGENHGKLVQELGPHSIMEHEGNYYVRTFIRTEKPLSL
jgi:multidrug efflux pump subunit AcrA (membrane-fusion protein)